MKNTPMQTNTSESKAKPVPRGSASLPTLAGTTCRSSVASQRGSAVLILILGLLAFSRPAQAQSADSARTKQEKQMREEMVKTYAKQSKEITDQSKVAKAAAEKADKLTKTAESKVKAKKPDAEKATADAEQARGEAADAEQELDDAIARFNTEKEARWVASLGTDAKQIRENAHNALTDNLDGAAATKKYLRALELGDRYAAEELAVLHLAGAYGVQVSPGSAIFYLMLPLSRPVKSEDRSWHEDNIARAIAVALKYLPEPDWNEVHAICKRAVEVLGDEGGKYSCNFRHILTILYPEKYPVKRNPSDPSRPTYDERKFPTKEAIFNGDWLNPGTSYMMTQGITSAREYYQDAVRLRAQRAADDRAYRQQMFQIVAGGMANMAQTFAQSGGGGIQRPYQAQIQQLQQWQMSISLGGLGTADKPGIVSMNPFAAALFTEHAAMNMSAPATGSPVTAAATADFTTLGLKNRTVDAQIGNARFSMDLPFGQRSSYEAAVLATQQALSQTTDPAQRKMLEALIQQNQRHADQLKSDIPIFNLTAPRPEPARKIERVITGSKSVQRPGTAMPAK